MNINFKITTTLKSRFKEIPRFSEQLPAPLNYFTIVNLIRFSELHDLVNTSGLMGLIHEIETWVYFHFMLKWDFSKGLTQYGH